MIKIITDHKWKEFLFKYEIPEKILKSEFNWIDDDTIDGFIKYKGNYHHISEFMRIPENSEETKGWDGVMNFSFSNGVLIKLSKDGERYQIAYYYMVSGE